MSIHTDSSTNRVNVTTTNYTCNGDPIDVATLVSDSATGYLASRGPNDYDWGNDECPDGPGCITWFGPGERYPDAQSALDAIKDVTWYAVWGNGNTQEEAGILSEHLTREEARAAAYKWMAEQDNPAVGAWTRKAD